MLPECTSGPECTIRLFCMLQYKCISLLELLQLTDSTACPGPGLDIQLSGVFWCRGADLSALILGVRASLLWHIRSCPRTQQAHVEVTLEWVLSHPGTRLKTVHAPIR